MNYDKTLIETVHDEQIGNFTYYIDRHKDSPKEFALCQDENIIGWYDTKEEAKDKLKQIKKRLKTYKQWEN